MNYYLNPYQNCTMSRSFSVIIVLFFSFLIHSRAEIALYRVAETNPGSGSYVMQNSQEQLIGQAFQQDALVSYRGWQYTVYYNMERKVCIARRRLPAGQWQEVVLPYKNNRDDAHNVITMGICKKDGSIHLAYDHHNDPLHYCRSVIGLANNDSLAWTAGNFGPTTNELETGVPVPDVTYPRFIEKPDGNLLFECRYKLSGDGDSYLREYDGDTHSWSLVGRYVQGMDTNPNSCAYINRMDYDKQGRLHVSWCWRDDFGGQTNHDLCYAYSDDHGRSWKDTYGNQVALSEAIQFTDSRTSGNCLRQGIASLKIADIPYNKGYINQETQSSDSKGRVHIVNSYMDSGTDSNWSSSRSKAVLHHRFRDTDGNWQHNLIHKLGQKVNSYCRVQIILDAFDNAYVIANGAEIYAASSAADYSDWELVSDLDAGRFCSEPQIDQNAIDEGILSFVYLARNNRLSVIDYLLDNPKPATGSGLKSYYYSDSRFSNCIDSAVGLPDSPAGADVKSLRCSGSLETRYGEAYTLYLNTTAASRLYVNGKILLNTSNTAEPAEYAVELPAINSHQYNIVIESLAVQQDVLELKWSGKRTAKQLIPAESLYPELNPAPELNLSAPGLALKKKLPESLHDGYQVRLETEQQELIEVEGFDPGADYSLEFALQIAEAGNRGFDFAARSGSGLGLRIRLNTDSLLWAAPLSGSELMDLCDNSQQQIWRIAQNRDSVYVYRNESFVCGRPAVEIPDLDAGGNTEINFASGIEVTDTLNLVKDPQFLKSKDNQAPVGWVSEKKMGGYTESRVVVDHPNWPGLSAFLFRFDLDAKYGTWYSLPVRLKPGSWHEFSFDNINWEANSGQFTLTASGNKEGTEGVTASRDFEIPAENGKVERKYFYFRSPESAEAEVDCYLSFKKKNYMSPTAITNLCLAEYSPASLSFGKATQGEILDYKLEYLHYDDQGAYAPGSDTGIETLPERQTNSFFKVWQQGKTLRLLSYREQARLNVYDLSGRTVYAQCLGPGEISLHLNPGMYIVQLVSRGSLQQQKLVVY